MVDIRFEPTKPEYVEAIAEIGLRESDELEVTRATGWDVKKVLTESCKRSTICYTVFVNGEPSVLFGAVPTGILTGEASIWMLATDRIYEGKQHITPIAVSIIADLKNRFSCLWNFVDAENVVSVKWLKKLGFKFDENPTPYGPGGHPFYRFEWRQEDV